MIVDLFDGLAAEYTLTREAQRRVITAAALGSTFSLVYLIGQGLCSTAFFLFGHEIQAIAGGMSAIVIGAGLSGGILLSTRPTPFIYDKRFKWFHRIAAFILMCSHILDLIQMVLVLINLKNGNEAENAVWWTTQSQSLDLETKTRIAIVGIVGSSVQLGSIILYCITFGYIARIHRAQPNVYDTSGIVHRPADPTPTLV